METSVQQAVEPVRLSWELRSTASIEEVWAILSDTDRFNRMAQLDFHYTEEPQPGGTTLRIGRTRRLGFIDLEWVELPARYQAPEWYKFIRRFRGSPVSEIHVLLRLRAVEGGTHVRYTVEAYPRNILFRPLVIFELYLFTRPSLDSALQKVMSMVASTSPLTDPRPPALGVEARKRLEGAISRLGSPELATNLSLFLRDSPLREQDRIHPLRQARAWNMEDKVVLRGFLQAVREGILTLHWDLICPNCQGAKERPAHLAEIKPRVHCPSCNVFFDATFPDSVSVSFRPHPAIRTFEVPVECMSSPGRQGHVVSQDELGRGGQLTFTPRLQAGPYRLRTWPPVDTAVIEVDPRATQDSAELVASSAGLSPARLRLRPGPVTLRVRSQLEQDVTLITERRWRPVDILTAGALLEDPTTRDILPELQPGGEGGQVTRKVVLAIAVERGVGDPALAAGLAALGATDTRVGAECVLALFEGVDVALRVLLQVSASTNMFAALSAGPVMMVSLGGTLTPLGRAVDEAISLQRGSIRDMIALPSTLATDPGLQSALEQGSFHLISAEYQTEGSPTAHWLAPSR